MIRIKPFALFVLALLISGLKVNALELRTLYGSTTTCNYVKKDIFVVWWDKNFDYREGAENVLNSLVKTRKVCLETFGMADPKGSDKYYYNIYIHNNGPDIFPDDWAQGQDTDNDGYPFLTIPYKLTSPDYHGHVHEGFHIFQIVLPGRLQSKVCSQKQEIISNGKMRVRYSGSRPLAGISQVQILEKLAYIGRDLEHIAATRNKAGYSDTAGESNNFQRQYKS